MSWENKIKIYDLFIISMIIKLLYVLVTVLNVWEIMLNKMSFLR